MKIRALAVTLLMLAVVSCNNTNDSSDAYGNFESRETLISAETAGKILQLNAEEGEQVKQGQVIAIIDTTQVVLAMEQLLAQQEATKLGMTTINAQVDVLEEQKKTFLTEQARLEKLVETKAAPGQKLDQVEGQVSVTDAKIKSTEASKVKITGELNVLKEKMKALETQYRNCFVKSPQDATVLETFAERGEVTAPGKPLVKLANLADMYLKVYVSGDQLPHIKLGDGVDILIDESKKENRTVAGTVSWISSQAEFTPKIIQTKEERVNLVYAVKVKVKNDGSIKIGMPGEMKLKK